MTGARATVDITKGAVMRGLFSSPSGTSIGLVTCALLGAAGCFGDAQGDAPPSNEDLAGEFVEATRMDAFLGEVEGTDARVVVTIREDGFTDVYVCGGDETFASHSRWFCPETLSEEGVAVTFDRDGWRMVAERQGDRVVGSLFAPDIETRTIAGGHEYAFEALAAGDDLQLGTFQRREGPDNCSGAIVWQERDEPVQMIGTYCFDDGVMKQVTPILQSMPHPESSLIKVLAGSGDDAETVYLLNNEIF